jgi:hypothetical protein
MRHVPGLLRFSIASSICVANFSNKRHIFNIIRY